MNRLITFPGGGAVGSVIGSARVLVLAMSLLSACKGVATNPTDGQCLDTRTYYAERIWEPVMSSACLRCHGPEGVAAQQNSNFILQTTSYPGFVDTNIANATTVAKIEFEGTSEMLLKPLGKMNHGGGQILEEGSPEMKALSEFVKRLQQGDTCLSPLSATSFSEVALMSAPETLRKAALELVGRVPSADELKAAEDSGDAALPDLLAAMMAEPAFFERLKEMFNDQFLTDKYLPRYDGDNNAVDILDEDDFPNRYWYESLQSTDDAAYRDAQRKTVQAVGREPLELISYIVRYDLPFTQVLTADYMMVNQFSAKSYGVDGQVSFAGNYDENDFQPARVHISRTDQDGKTEEIDVPHAGILTSTMFLDRYPTTDTNLNRHRARMIFKYFLATDVLKIAERPINITSLTSTNPTRDDPFCNVCHKVIDPVASTFQSWDEDGRFFPKPEWPLAMPQPGINNKTVSGIAEYPSALHWLADQIVQDVRFPVGVVHTMYTALTGKAPLTYPAGTTPEAEAARRAWTAQDGFLRKVADAFVTSGYNLKSVITAIVMSPYFRAKELTDELSSERALEFADLGTMHISSPEQLSRKIRAITGTRWMRNEDQEWLLDDYRILYGGIDSDSVVQRLRDPNGIVANIAWRMANEVSCDITAWDFTKAKASRRFFPIVDTDVKPEWGDGKANNDAVQLIKKNIQHLHRTFLGEELELDDPEINATYQLFYDTWKDLKTAGSTSLPGNCRETTDRETGNDLPSAQQITSDANYTVRSWMAVLTYLLADYRFLYE